MLLEKFVVLRESTVRSLEAVKQKYESGYDKKSVPFRLISFEGVRRVVSI
jgi:hypothetical protein